MFCDEKYCEGLNPIFVHTQVPSVLSLVPGNCMANQSEVLTEEYEILVVPVNNLTVNLTVVLPTLPVLD